MSIPALLLLPFLAQEPSPAPAASPAAAPAADVVRVAGRDVPWPKRTKSVQPVYPAAAQAVGQRGIVIVQLLVGPDGKVVSAELVRSVPPFDEPALGAARQWEYEVTRVNGQPVPVQLIIPITFALRLPDVSREPGIPEMRQGVAPPSPAGAVSKPPARVTAELALDTDGQVKEAVITGGDPPFTEALLQAVRTWAFVPPSAPGGVSLNVEATFSGKEGQRVQLRLFGLRELAGVPAAAPPSPAPVAVAPAPGASAPPAVQPATPVTTAPVAAVPPTAAPDPSVPKRATSTQAAARPAGDVSASPAVEVVPGPPPARPTDTTIMEAGVSAVRDVTLTAGVPDLTSGRRPLVPPLARMEGVTGQVEVRFVVEASGATSNLEVEGPDRLKESARQTVNSWTFRRTSTERLFLVTTLDYGAEAARGTVKR